MDHKEQLPEPAVESENEQAEEISREDLEKISGSAPSRNVLPHP
jgi:hypothetical protein